MNVAKDPNAKYGLYGATQAAVLPDQTLVYTITCENEGSGTAYSVYIVDTLSAQLDETTLDLGGKGQYSAALRQVSWDIGDLAPKGAVGSTGEVTFTIKPRAGLPAGTEILNQAVVYFPSVPEVTPTNVVINTIQAVAAIPQTVQAVAGSARAITLQGTGVGALSYSIVDATLLRRPEWYAAQRELHGRGWLHRGGLLHLPRRERRPTERAGAGLHRRRAESRRPDAANSPMGQPGQWRQAAYAKSRHVHRHVGRRLLSTGDDPVLRAAGRGNCHRCQRAAAVNGQQMNATVHYVAGLNQVVLTPRQAMVADNVYALTVTTGVKDSKGNALAAPFTASFQLGDQAEDEPGVYLPLVTK